MAEIEPFKDKYKLYLMHLCFAFVSRMWDMGIVLLVAELTHNSLFFIAMIGLLSAVSVFLFMGTIGEWLDKTSRLTAVRVCMFVKFLLISVVYILCSYLSAYSPPQGEGIIAFHKTILYFVVFLSAGAGVMFATMNQSVEKDWIVVLSAGNSAWLSSTNSVMTQIDLGCKSLAPALTGLLFAYLSHSVVALILLVSNAVVAIGLYWYMMNLYHAWPSLAVKRTVPTATNNKNTEDQNHKTYESIEIETFSHKKSLDEGDVMPRRRCCSSLLSPFQDFLSSGCVGTMVSYSALYLTVLSYGSLMTVYVRWAGVTDDWVGITRGISAVTGYLGAVLFPGFSQKVGLYDSGVVAIVYQFLLVFLAASSFFWASRFTTVVIVIVTVLLSRTGLWLFDLCARQIAQQTIPELTRGKVNGQWRSMTAFFEMLAYLIALLIPDPADFWILTTISAVMVGFAMLTFIFSSQRAFSCFKSFSRVFFNSDGSESEQVNLLQ